MRRMVVYESRLELARIMLADCDPMVVTIAAQPFQLDGSNGGRTRRHVPDLLLVDRAGGVTVVDVNAPHKRDDPQVRALMAWTRDVVGLRGWGFEEWYGAPRQMLANVGFLAGLNDRGRRTVPGCPGCGRGAAGGAASGVARRVGHRSDRPVGRAERRRSSEVAG